MDAILSPGRNPGYIIDGIQGLLPEIIFSHGDKPLLSGSENHRFFTAPAVGILVCNLLFLQKGAYFRKLIIHHTVCFKHLKTAEKIHIKRKTSPVIYWGIDIQTICQTGFIIFPTMTGRRMNTAAARFQRNIAC